MNTKRLKAGIPALEHQGKKVVSADAVALLSGVNFGSVEKVIAALSLIEEFTGTDMSILTRFSDVPSDRVKLGEATDKVRADNTMALVERIARAPWPNDIESLLHLRGRFSM